VTQELCCVCGMGSACLSLLLLAGSSCATDTSSLRMHD
jgi:hypothetical protein